jgi:hypothetical protein
MEPFEIDIIQCAFARCYGLQDAVKANTRGIISMLAQQTGLRTDYLTAHLQQIRSL